jgi:hypothetical protein
LPAGSPHGSAGFGSAAATPWTARCLADPNCCTPCRLLAKRLTPSARASYRLLMPVFEARRGEIVWRFEPAADGSMRVLMGNGQQFVQVAAVRSESDLNLVED